MHMGLFVGPWVFSEDPFVWEKNKACLLVGPLGLFMPKNQIKTNFKPSILLMGSQQTIYHSETTNSFLDICNLF